MVGNIGFAKAYSSALLDKGYSPVVVDGYENWPNIKRDIKDVDAVIVITGHISHENMWRIKEYMTSTKVIYSQFDGANRITEELEKHIS